MNSISEFTQTVIRSLAQAGDLSGADVIPAHEPSPKRCPLPRPAIAVGVEAVDLQQAALGGYLGAQGQESLYGGRADITLRLDLYVPQTQGAARLHLLYERLCDALLLREQAPARFVRLWCDRVDHDKSSGALHLCAYALARAALVREARLPAVPIEKLHLTVDA